MYRFSPSKGLYTKIFMILYKISHTKILNMKVAEMICGI